MAVLDNVGMTHTSTEPCEDPPVESALLSFAAKEDVFPLMETIELHDEGDEDFLSFIIESDHNGDTFTPRSGMYLTGNGDSVYCTRGEGRDFTACDSECGYCGRC